MTSKHLKAHLHEQSQHEYASLHTEAMVIERVIKPQRKAKSLNLFWKLNGAWQGIVISGNLNQNARLHTSSLLTLSEKHNQ